MKAKCPMDPITRAARVFLAEAEAFWRAEPMRVLPLFAAPSERGEVVKALRLQELSPDNRRPLFLFEEPFAESHAYLDGLAEAIRQDYEQIRRGVAEEGVTLPPFPATVQAREGCSAPMQRAVVVLELAARLLGDPFEGLCMALVPRQVADRAGWQESMATLHRVRLSARVRIAVFAPPDGPLHGMSSSLGAHLHIDEAELRDYLRRMDSTTSEGSRSELPAPETAMQLRRLLLDAAARTAAGPLTPPAQTIPARAHPPQAPARRPPAASAPSGCSFASRTSTRSC
jgi:hypothetical protein